MDSIHEEASQWRGSLMVFTKTRLFLLFLMSMILGTSFFLLGYVLGYTVGQEKAVDLATQALLHPDQVTKKPLRDAVILLEKQKQEKIVKSGMVQSNRIGLVTYVVHIGLFTDLQYAKQAWEKTQHNSRLAPYESIIQIFQDGSRMYKVILGKFKNKEEALVFARSIASDPNNHISPAIEESYELLNPLKPAEKTNS